MLQEENTITCCKLRVEVQRQDNIHSNIRFSFQLTIQVFFSKWVEDKRSALCCPATTAAMRFYRQFFFCVFCGTQLISEIFQPMRVLRKDLNLQRLVHPLGQVKSTMHHMKFCSPFSSWRLLALSVFRISCSLSWNGEAGYQEQPLVEYLYHTR